MSRKYPAFIYQKVINAKSPGEYIVSTLYPAFLASVKVTPEQDILICILKKYDSVGDEEYELKILKMKKWYKSLHLSNPVNVND